MGFFINMNLRVLAHYKDGSTKTFENSTDKMDRNQLTSLQLQANAEKMWTLSARNNENAIFYQRDRKKSAKILSRSILKKLGKDCWINLSVNCKKEAVIINILEESIL